MSCPLDGKFNVMRSFSHASRLPCSSDSMANDVSSAVATPHLFLAGQRTSAVAVGCSAPDTLDLYHECSRETSSGLRPSHWCSRSVESFYNFPPWNPFSTQVTSAAAHGTMIRTIESNTSSRRHYTRPLTGTLTARRVVSVWHWRPMRDF